VFGFLVINVCNHGEHYETPCTCGILMPYEFSQSGRGLRFILLLISASFVRQNHLKDRRFTVCWKCGRGKEISVKLERTCK